ncbi:MAG: ferritin family protein [Anaerolineae bacterium]|nr:MAG: ferritin family protein [Anaerolineae bacterium]
MMADLNVMDALKIAMDSEQKARQFYLDAKEKVSDGEAYNLLSQLAAFEQHHYDKLAALCDSLSQDKGYIAYTPPDVALPAVSHGVEGSRTAKEHNLETVIGVLTAAIDAEKSARSRYEELAEQTADPNGRAMFRQLAEEEHTHYRILSDELYNLSNRGLWIWAE